MRFLCSCILDGGPLSARADYILRDTSSVPREVGLHITGSASEDSSQIKMTVHVPGISFCILSGETSDRVYWRTRFYKGHNQASAYCLLRHDGATCLVRNAECLCRAYAGSISSLRGQTPPVLERLELTPPLPPNC